MGVERSPTHVSTAQPMSCMSGPHWSHCGSTCISSDGNCIPCRLLPAEMGQHQAYFSAAFTALVFVPFFYMSGASIHENYKPISRDPSIDRYASAAPAPAPAPAGGLPCSAAPPTVSLHTALFPYAPRPFRLPSNTWPPLLPSRKV